jgi:hypothetical protein
LELYLEFGLNFKALITIFHNHQELLFKNLIITLLIMSFRAFTLFDINASPFEVFASTFKSTLPFVFGCIIQPNQPFTTVLVRD